MNQKPVATAAIPALGPTCGELAARAVGVEPGTLDDETVWAYLMRSTEPGAYCPLDRRDVARYAGRIVIPTGEGA